MTRATAPRRPARRTTSPALVLPPGANVVVIQSGAGLEVQVHGVKLADVEAVANWLQAFWDRRGEAVPELTPATSGMEVSGEDPELADGRRSKRAGFTV